MSPVTRSRLLWLAAGVVVLGVVAVAVRVWLGEQVVRAVLRMAGATEIRLEAVRGTPWDAEVTGLSFRLQGHDLALGKVRLQRRHWWEASLGDVTVDNFRAPVFLDNSDIDPLAWRTYGEEWKEDPVPPPFRSLNLTGELVVRATAVPDRSVMLTLRSSPLSDTSWIGSLLAEAEGFRLAGNGTLMRAGQELNFQISSAELDLATWSAQIQRLVALPGGFWTMGGRLTGEAEGKVTARRFAATARVSLRDARMEAQAADVAASGVDVDLEFSDLWKLRTSAGRLRLETLRVGRLSFEEIEAPFGLWDGTGLKIGPANGRGLGGQVRTEAFATELSAKALDIRLNLSDLDVARLLELMRSQNLRASGRLEGEILLNIHGAGARVVTGRLSLPAAVAAELQVTPAVLLRSGAQLDAASERTLRAVPGRNALIRLAECTVEIRPPGLPLGVTARCQVRGKLDGQPVEFTHLVSGAIESLFEIRR